MMCLLFSIEHLVNLTANKNKELLISKEYSIDWLVLVVQYSHPYYICYFGLKKIDLVCKHAKDKVKIFVFEKVGLYPLPFLIPIYTTDIYRHIYLNVSIQSFSWQT